MAVLLTCGAASATPRVESRGCRLGARGIRIHATRADWLAPGVHGRIIPKVKSDFHSMFSMVSCGVVAGGGIEPPTQGFSVLCSTNRATQPPARSAGTF